MAITKKSIKILWANAAGRCSFPECREKLCTIDAGNIAPYTVGEMAHICGERPGANRHDPSQDAAERDDYENLILLCPNHHTLIDKPENERKHNAEVLRAMKEKHEEFVGARLNIPAFSNKNEVATCIFPLMMENHEVFKNFGPQSDIARKNPDSDSHGVWLSERLATIVPNNRRMFNITHSNRHLFDLNEQAALARFGLHVRSYDRWVHDEISYEGVVRFPPEFEKLILELAHAST